MVAGALWHRRVFCALRIKCAGESQTWIRQLGKFCDEGAIDSFPTMQTTVSSQSCPRVLDQQFSQRPVLSQRRCANYIRGVHCPQR